jgi:muconolactone D-isomerase
MEYLVETAVHWPLDGDPQRLAALALAEADRAKTLTAQGTLKRLWRVPGTRNNVGLWQAADATELHQALSSLPFFPWMSIQVRPMAVHPNDPANR